MIGRSLNFDLKLTRCASEDVKKKLASEPKTKDSFPFLENFTQICIGYTFFPYEERVIFMSNAQMERVVFDSRRIEDSTHDIPHISNSFPIKSKIFLKNFNELRKLIGKKQISKE